jgi:hypothetical protein
VDETIPEGVIDTGRIEMICSLNSYRPDNELLAIKQFQQGNKPSPGYDLFDESPAGLWILPSFINHSCLQNSYRIFYGNLLMVYAIQDLKKGRSYRSIY